MILTATKHRSSASYAATILATSGLVAFWELADSSGSSTAADSGPNGITGTPTSVTFGVSGQSGQTSASFNGSTSIVSLPDSTFITGSGVTSWTIEGWVYSTAAEDGSAMFTEPFVSNTLRMELGFDDTGHTHTDTKPFVGYYNGNTTGWQQAFAPSSLALSQWVYLVGTFDGTTLKIYVDASLGGSGTPTTGLPTANSSGLIIGRRHETAVSTGWFHGSIQYVAIYNRALTGTEVSAHYAAI